MGRVLLGMVGALVVLAAGFAAWRFWPAGEASGPVADGRCTAEAPCRVRILFQYTQAGLAQLQPRTVNERARLKACYAEHGDYGFCMINQIAKDDTAALEQAFLRSGVTEVTDGRPNIVFEAPAVPLTPSNGVDWADPMRLDAYGAYADPAEFNVRLLDALPKNRLMKRYAKDYTLVVVFTGLVDQVDKGCLYNSVSRWGYVVLPGCVTAGYLLHPRLALEEQLLFLHEAGHIFGAAHNDNGLPQPCAQAARSGFSPTACAYEACLDKACDKAGLELEPRAFCTLVGQFNYGGQDSFCRAHRGGEMGSGWVREYSHDGSCRTPGFEGRRCGDAAHDAATAMRARVWRVTHTAPGVKR